jgi:hypothetical protein
VTLEVQKWASIEDFNDKNYGKYIYFIRVIGGKPAILTIGSPVMGGKTSDLDRLWPE